MTTKKASSAAAAAAAGWNVDAFDDGQAKKAAADAELVRLQTFVTQHKAKLENVVNAVERSLGVSYDASLEPIELRFEPYEGLSVLQLVHTENKTLNKVLMALSSLCVEVETLVNEARDFYYPSLVMYGETPSGVPVEEGEAQVMMGRMLLFLQDLCNFVNRVYEVFKNIMRQLASLWTPNKVNSVHFDITNVHYMIMYEKLADLLGVLLALDQIIASNDHLLDHWTLYKRMIALIRTDPTRFEADETKLRLVEKMLQRMEGLVLDNMIYQNCIEQLFDMDDLVNVTKNMFLGEEMAINLRNYFVHLKERIGSAAETDQRVRFVGFCGLFVFHFKIFRPNVDKNYFKQIYLMHKLVPVIQIFGNVQWSPSDFFDKQVPKLVQLLGKSEVPQSRQASLKKIVESLPQLASDWYHTVCVWMVRMSSEVALNSKIRDVLNTRTALFIQGLSYAYSVNTTISETINIHLLMGTPLSKKVARPLCRLIELLKAIEATYRQQAQVIGNGLVNVFQHLSTSVFSIVAPVRDKMLADRRSIGKSLDAYAGLNLLANMVDGPPTRERMILAELALATAMQQPNIMKTEELNEVQGLLRKMDILSTLQHRLSLACDCHLMYWNRVLLPTYFSDMYSMPHDAHNMQYMMAAIRDTKPVLDRCMNEPAELIKKFEIDIERLVTENIVNPLSKDIETDLRLHIHSHLKLDDRNPFKVGLKDLTAFLSILPLRFFARTLDIKAVVTHYLDMTFYNLTTVALHDWRTYAEMRNLALEKYDIHMTEVHLPSGTLEQGIDALEIMRNIHVFVTRYSYNLNNQIFVERNSNNKHLNTINIRHIANSIRTHGTGVMNTTVNVTYQFLRKKFRTFSEFLYDDHIKSRLIKDIRFYRESKEDLGQKYPYDRAEKFNKSIRKLGQTSDGGTYLDEFRNLVTTIGNAMGYIRMVRSGGLHYCSNAINFVPDLNDILRLEDLVMEEHLSTETAAAAKNLDAAVQNLSKNFSESTDYFQLLVDVFAKEFRDTKNMHLKNFYIIIPPLTLNFVDYMINSKDKIDKKRKDGAAFTDDGFAMGLAYILKLLDQNAAFDSLHWFASVDEHYVREAQKMSDPKKRGDEQQSIVLTQQKIQVFRKEFDLLYFSLTGARIFFREEGENFAAATAEKEENAIQAEAAAQPLEAAPAPPTIDG